ncbi:Holliday junction branch migration protein RuvA [Gordonia shandongensis]|uniref:Holliday junction branch migration protein RuvA n=1 Tax=Gordonia shandongensis TaxID=376351 RepID=UPI0004006B58|nr:Holliday junction branch migration protein RuvA [Gordonia shandongensis]
MIASVSGEVIDIALDHVVVECAGVGYRVQATPPTLGTLSRGATARLLTTMVVREDAMTLYGFTDPEARDLFILLQTVTGVGPRLAMATLAVLEPQSLRRALADSDTKALTAVPGIGKRVAERLVVELRDKVPAVAGPEAPSVAAPVVGGVGAQVAEALVGLGFTESAAQKAVTAVLADDPDADSAAVLRASLGALGPRR